MKFLIVVSSPLPILIPLGPKYSPQDAVFKYPLSRYLMMKSVAVRLQAILADVLGSILKGVVCSCLVLGIYIDPFYLLHYVV